MMPIKKTWLLLIGLLLLGQWGNAQALSKEDLEKKKTVLLKEISEMQQELAQTDQSKAAGMSAYYALLAQVKTRESLINTYAQQLALLDTSIVNTQERSGQMDEEVKKLKDEYAKMVVYSYKHRGSYNKLLFIFSAENFNEIIRRLRYVKKMNAYRHSKVSMIRMAQEGLLRNLALLKNSRKEKSNDLEEQKMQKTQLASASADKDKMVKQLAKQHSKILADLNDRKKQQQKLEGQIADLIKKEIQAAAARAKATADSLAAASAHRNGNSTPAVVTVPNSSGGTAGNTAIPRLTPEAKALSASFAGNQGHLPWPVESGVIIESFGVHAHPVLKEVTTKNNGVDIKTTGGATVRAVFQGTVVGIIINPSYHKAVLVKHGDYFTVYSNLATVSVKAGDVLTTLEPLGVAYTDDSPLTFVHFELWNGTTLLNPESWLQSK